MILIVEEKYDLLKFHSSISVFRGKSNSVTEVWVPGDEWKPFITLFIIR